MKGAMALSAYDLAPDGGAKFREKLADYYPQDGSDGMVCDKEGNIYAAIREETRLGLMSTRHKGKSWHTYPFLAFPPLQHGAAERRSKSCIVLLERYSIRSRWRKTTISCR